MQKPGFDPHLDLASVANLVSNSEIKEYLRLDKLSDLCDNDRETYKKLKAKRHGAKTTNYACTYGAMPPKIAAQADIPLSQAKELYNAYWDRNNAIRKVASAQHVETLDEYDNEKWLLNPVSGFYYSLRHEKDRFSTLNQGTGSYCFDTWIGFVLKEREQITGQFHDEGIWVTPEGYEQRQVEILERAIEKANKYLDLNVQLRISYEFGTNYGEVH
jgi:DNA polymerase I-like protein with 3'-5' exonuclease and polymerase domains